MEQTKVSLITTVLNEQESIKAFLDSVTSQSRLPDEFVLVDAGSTDNTLKLIKKHSINKKLDFKLIKSPGINRSKARNQAIDKAKYSVIAVTDAGCVLDEHWLERLCNPFENKNVEASAGFYQVEVDSVLQKSIAPFVAVMPDQLDVNSFLPSSRSVAFTKKAWQEAGRYPEKLNYCEDLVFSKNLKEHTNLVVIPSALVYWQITDSMQQFFLDIYHYAGGDLKAGYKPHLKKIYSVFARYVVFLSFPPFLLLYQFWPIIRYYHYVGDPLALVYLPFIQLIKDMAIISAALSHLWSKRKHH